MAEDSRSPRKPLIRQREKIRLAGLRVRTDLHQIRRECMPTRLSPWEAEMTSILRRLWQEERGQDIAEYAVMLAVILVIVVGTIRLIGTNANNVFSSVASSVQ